MATRSTIGVQNQDGTITGIYCHFDGYPTHHVPLLTEHYETEEKARALVALGDLSVLDAEVGDPNKEPHSYGNPRRGWCVAYGRDRGEDDVEPCIYDSADDMVREEFAYLFRDGQWFASDGDSGWMPAREFMDMCEERE